MKKLISGILSATMLVALAVPAFAVDTVTSGDAAALDQGKSTNTIPVQISAEATVFDVDVPTAFPTTLNPSTGETTTASNATITNNSYGAIVVSEIKATNAGTWSLAAFDKDMSKVQVDSKLIGLQVTPNGGNAQTVGTALATTDASKTEQTLLAAGNAEWVINGKDAADGSNTLTVNYETNASAVSAAITNETVAKIVITIAWNTNI